MNKTYFVILLVIQFFVGGFTYALLQRHFNQQISVLQLQSQELKDKHPPVTTIRTGDKVSHKTIAEIQHQIRLLQDAIQELQTTNTIKPITNHISENPSQDSQRPANTNRSIELTKEEEISTTQSLAEHLDSSMSENRLDDQSLDQHRDKIISHFEEHGLSEKQLRTLECSEIYCKMTITNNSRIHNTLPLILGGGPFTDGSFYYQSGDGSETILFAALPQQQNGFEQVLIQHNEQNGL